MNRDRAVAIVTSTGMILTWLANAASPRPEPVVQPVAQVAVRSQPQRPEPADALAFDVDREAARLRVRIAEAPAPKRSGRNPFAFAERRSLEAPRARAPRRLQDQTSELSATPPAVPPLSIKLIGVAERTTGDGTVRTAVISGPADVFLVGVDDQVLGRYTVVGIGADAVEILDALTGQPVRLALR